MQDLSQVSLAVLGDGFHCLTRREVEFCEDFLIVVNIEGDIMGTYLPDHADYKTVVDTLENAKKLTRLSKGQYLMPGLVDLHCHAPQWPQAGKGLDLPLYDWLQTYTFPLESRYKDVDFASDIYQDVVRTLLANGTTSAVYFGSIHRESTELLARACLSSGQRAYVGKVNMDNPKECPEYYCESSEEALAETALFVDNVLALAGNESRLVSPVVTPRFVPSCTPSLLQKLGDLVQRHNLHMQTHCAESDWAYEYSLTHFGKSDVEIYADAGLLNNKSILAHSIFVNENDIKLLREYQAGIAHCPLSNMYFGNAAMRSRELLDSGVQIGLGSDIAGAPSPSVFRACFDAVSHSRVREEGVNSLVDASVRGSAGARIDFKEAFWMATRGGAQVLDSKVGAFEAGYHFDAIVVEASKEVGNLRIYPQLDSSQDILEKIISLAQRENIKRVWVQGNQVISR